MKIKISEIDVGKRYRKDLGDVQSLAQNMQELGQLQAIGITPDKRLIFGQRRIEAAKLNEWDEIDAVVIDMDLILAGEYAENMVRKDFTISERVAIAEALKKTLEGREGRPKMAENVPPLGETRDIVAKKAGLGSGKNYEHAKKVIASGDADLIKKMNDTNIVNEAFKDLKAKAFKANIAQQKEDIAAGRVLLPKGKYELISIDPPWPYGTPYEADGRRVANPYPEMSLADICNLQLPAAQDCCLYLWTTHQFLPDAFNLLKMWGFDYKQTLVWDKEIMGMGAWHRCQVEFCLFAVRGKPIWADHSHRDIIREKRREHSRKPDAFFQMVDATCVGRKLDYFSRTQRPGWDCMGNDLKWKEGK